MSLRLPGECEHYVKAEACRFCADVPALRAALRECVEALDYVVGPLAESLTQDTIDSDALIPDRKEWDKNIAPVRAALSRAKRLVRNA